jgi:hypothetical protein
MFQTKVVEKIKTHNLCSIIFFSENRTVYEMWKNTTEPGRPQMTTWCMRIACWITRATNTHSQYVVLHFRGNSGCTNVTHCYGISTLLVLSVNSLRRPLYTGASWELLTLHVATLLQLSTLVI